MNTIFYSPLDFTYVFLSLGLNKEFQGSVKSEHISEIDFISIWKCIKEIVFAVKLFIDFIKPNS